MDTLKIKQKSLTFTLTELIPKEESDSRVFKFSSEVDYKIGYNELNKLFIRTVRGPIITEGEKIIVENNEGVLKELKVQEIIYKENMGHLVRV